MKNQKKSTLLSAQLERIVFSFFLMGVANLMMPSTPTCLFRPQLDRPQRSHMLVHE